MTRLIDADALKKSIMLLSLVGKVDITNVITEINRQPTIDAEPVTRCRDCQFSIITAWRGEEAEPEGWGCRQWHRPTDPDGFCHKGKRRKDK